MPQWDTKFIGYSYLVNNLQQVIEDENKETGNNQKFSRKLPEQNVKAI